MLPFLEPKNMSASIISAGRTEPRDDQDEREELPHSVREAAEMVLRALEKRSPIDLAMSLRDLFDEFDAMPHYEGEHTNDDDYGE